MDDLSGRVCIVTGSTRGIGRAIAEGFTRAGGKVVVSGRRQQDCELVAGEIAAAHVGGTTLAIAAQMADSQSVNALVQRTIETWGTVDVLVNNAGIARDHFISRITDEEWNEVLAVNLSGPMFATRAVVPIMKDRERGSIINVISWAGTHGNVGQATYSASKAGLHGLTLSCAKELAKFSIRVNALSPMFPTEMAGAMPEELQEKALKRVPMHRVGTAFELAEAALYLASDRSSYTTGQVLNVDGGMHLT